MQTELRYRSRGGDREGISGSRCLWSAVPCSDIRPEESEECRAPGRSPPRLMVFQGPQR